MIITNPNEPIRYVLRDERDDPDASVFYFRPVNVARQKRLESVRDAVNMKRAVSFNIELLRMCLMGWENVKDADGNEVPFQTMRESRNGASGTPMKDPDGPSDETLDRLPWMVRNELAEAALGLHSMDEDDVKN